MAELLVPLGFLVLLAGLLYAAVRLTLKSFGNVATAIAQAKQPAPAAPAPAPARKRGLTPSAQPLTRADRDLVSQIMDGMLAQLAHEEDMVAARGTEACAVRLAPQVPIRDAASPRSWLGGGARLPAGMAWPRMDGVDACVLAQISLADLPADVWDGLGPRTGWLLLLAHPDSWDVRVQHLPTADVYHAPPRPVGPAYCWSQSEPRAGQIAHLPRLWPQWPVVPVAVRPSDPDPYIEGRFEGQHSRYKAGYDLREAGLHPFDWSSLLALCDVLEAWMADMWKPVDPEQPSPLAEQLRKSKARLADPDLSMGDRQRIEQNIAFLPTLIAATDAARLTNDESRARAKEIIAIVRETHAAGEPFSANDAAAVVDALGAIEWVRVMRDDNHGAAQVRTLRLPLTRHDMDATSWVYAYDQRHADLAKRAYCADPASLPAPQRAHYEPRWQAQAQHEMPSMGHVPFGYVHDFDPATDVTLIEIPTGHLVDWMFGDCYHLVLTMKKADLAAGQWDKVLVQISN